MLLFTSGDPFSVTVEVLARLLRDSDTARAAVREHPVLITGSLIQWSHQLGKMGCAVPSWTVVAGDRIPERPGFYFIDTPAAAADKPADQMTPAERGELTVRSLDAAARLIRLRNADQPTAVVTGPIDKHAAALAGFPHPGQTEYFESLCGTQAVMLLAGPRLRVGLVTNHHALRQVPDLISAELIRSKLRLLIRTLQRSFAIARPRVAVLGLNPHTGDHGLFGDEEIRVIGPAVMAARQELPEALIEGPVPADTAFHRALHGAFDAVLAMYHDQGLGPLKTVHFDDAVNVSGGLPVLRVSPDHGPAADLFLRQKASSGSFAAALDLAVRHVSQRAGSAGPDGVVP